MGTTFSFLIIGAGRGGTSLLAGLLDGHSRLEVGFEKSSVRWLMGRALWLRLFGSNERLLQQRAGGFVRACRWRAAAHPGKLWGNKITTEQLGGLEDHNRLNPGATVDVLDYFFREALAGVRVITLLRDGRTCVRSKVRRTGQPVEDACRWWKYSFHVHEYLRLQHPACIAVRFEDLVREPREVLGRLCSFLGVAFEEGMLAGTSSGKMRPEYRRPGLDRSVLALEDVSDRVVALLEPELRAAGYIA